MNKKVFAVMAILSMVFVGFQFAEPVTAQPLTKSSMINVNSANGKMKTTVVLQASGPNHVKIIKKTFIRINSHSPWRLSITDIKSLNKVNMNTLKITGTNPPFTKLVKTRLTAIQSI